jgi:hypothetical protein
VENSPGLFLHFSTTNIILIDRVVVSVTTPLSESPLQPLVEIVVVFTEVEERIFGKVRRNFA